MNHAALTDLLHQHAPFDKVDTGTLVQQALRRPLAIGETLQEGDTPPAALWLIQHGAVEVRAADGELLAKASEGELAGLDALFDADVRQRIVAMEPGLAWGLPLQELHRLMERHPALATALGADGADRIRLALSGNAGSGLDLLTTPVGDLATRAPVTATLDTRIHEAAATMRDARVSALLITGDDGQLSGILTDRDLRNRVLARGLDGQVEVAAVMTPDPMTVEAERYAFEALMLMTGANVHHLPVMRGGLPAGMITVTDLMRHQAGSPVLLVSDIHKRGTVAELTAASSRIPTLFLRLVEAGTRAYHVGRIISAIGEALTCRLLTLAEQAFGPPPVPYAWVIGGSQARQEQTAHSDQDNAMILDDSYDPAQHGDYFRRLATYVCDGLDACGYIYCPGDIMATNAQWRQPLAVWKRYFRRWIEQPEPEALLNASVFFDLRAIHGQSALASILMDEVLARTPKNAVFLGLMAGNALTRQPPLGFFRNFVLVKGGAHDQTLDLKLRGVVPVIDLARVHALAVGAPALNTEDRLALAAEGGAISSRGAADLCDALALIADVRLAHQARRLKAGEPADNFVPPESLSHFERGRLKDAFTVVRDMQAALASRYPLARLT